MDFLWIRERANASEYKIRRFLEMVSAQVPMYSSSEYQRNVFNTGGFLIRPFSVTLGRPYSRWSLQGVDGF